jgi:hypothetical protein
MHSWACINPKRQKNALKEAFLAACGVELVTHCVIFSYGKLGNHSTAS